MIGIILLTFNINYTEQKNKPDLYLFFAENSEAGMSKQVRKNDKEVIKNNKVVSKKYDYDIYTYSESSIRYRLATIDKSVFCIKDEIFAKKNAIKFNLIKKIKNIYFDSTDLKNFPYKRVFIVEYLSKNQYKVIQVNTYLGSDY